MPLIPCPKCHGDPQKRGSCLWCRFTGQVFETGDTPPAPGPRRRKKRGTKAKITRVEGGGVKLTGLVLGVEVEADLGDLLEAIGKHFDDDK